jgi:hypothetical protein
VILPRGPYSSNFGEKSALVQFSSIRAFLELQSLTAISRLTMIGLATPRVGFIVSLIEYWPINDRAALVQGSGVQTAGPFAQ